MEVDSISSRVEQHVGTEQQQYIARTVGVTTCCGRGQPEGERSGLEGSSCPQSPLQQHPSGHPAPRQQPMNPLPAVLQCPRLHCHALQLIEPSF